MCVCMFSAVQNTQHKLTFQLKIYYSKYLTDNAISSVSDLTKEQVAEMGIMLCGIPPADIEKFPVYR